MRQQENKRPKYIRAVKDLGTSGLLPVTAIYVTFCLFWAGLAHWIGPSIAAAAHAGKIPLILYWSAHTGGPLPVEHYMEVWSTISWAVQFAAILHLVIVLFIWSVDQKHPSFEKGRGGSHSNFALIVFAAMFLGLCIVIGPKGDHLAYIKEWRFVLDGGDPWRMIVAHDILSDHFAMYNVYGPLFSALAPFILITPLANKLLFAFSYLAFVIWLTKDFGRAKALAPLSWPVIFFWFANPFVWIELAVFGHFDVLVGLACVAAVHEQVRGKDVFSGACLATGVLLKFMPIVILPFLTFNKRCFRPRLFSACSALIVGGFLLCVLIWGRSTFEPIMLALSRTPDTSIYEFLSAGIFLNADWVEKPLGLAVGLGVFIWSMMSRIGPALSAALAILVTLLFYRLGYNNYQMVLFLVISYWAVSRWEVLKERRFLVALLVGYFGFLAIVDTAIWLGFEGYGHYSMVVVLFKFILGCALLGGLIQFSAYKYDCTTA